MEVDVLSRLSQHKRHSSRQRERKHRTREVRQSRSTRMQVMIQKRYKEGYDAGYHLGKDSGQERFEHPIEGTSIIIPTYNKLDLLSQCIESIQRHTREPYEIIVVDNASTDGTAAYLHKLAGQIRYCIHDRNYGFSGAVNTGLMMAKGKKLCLLNNDVIVTPNWLDNLLNCLESEPSIGIVGPVTNIISGNQQIPVPYEHIRDMLSFAREHNQQDPSKWKYVDRIVGFCFLFSREYFDQIGYFDEGYEIGNYEDEDFIIRTRLAGRKLVIAGDSFIHHFGSQTMKELGTQHDEVHFKNEAFYQQKWGNPYEWVHRIKLRCESSSLENKGALCTSSFYPTHVAVTGLNGTVYWLEHGVKYPIQGSYRFPIVQLSQIELLGWKTGSVIEAEAAASKWRTRSNNNGSIPDGGVFMTAPGRWYQRDGNTYREFMSEYALKRWGMSERVTPCLEEDRASLIEGLPIMAAPILSRNHL